MKRLNSFRRGERIFRNVVANVAEAAIGFTAELLTAVWNQKTSKSGHAQLRDTWFRSASSTGRRAVLNAQLASPRRRKKIPPVSRCFGRFSLRALGEVSLERAPVAV
jgi:hypothetical protein